MESPGACSGFYFIIYDRKVHNKGLNMPFELIKSEVLLQGRAFNVKRDTLKTPE